MLFCFSLLFYSLGEPKYVILLFLSVIFNFASGLLIHKLHSQQRPALCRAVFVLALGLNVGPLVFFKYATLSTFLVNTGFVREGLSSLLLLFGINRSISHLNILLPLGISFYTFQAISYIFDVYRKRIPATRSVIDFGAYLTMFPQLIAGPIVRYESIAKELTSRQVRAEKFLDGCVVFLGGLVKKLLIADILALPADQIFGLSASELTTGLAWFGSLCYTLQIYFDFSGYSDMAIGLGKMLGFTFPVNFNYPYTAVSIRDFWRRWHISLSTWFRDYVYIPLGGSRGSTRTTYLNLFFIFFLCAVWHGAEWTFIIWGVMHGLCMVAERLGLEAVLKKLPRPLQHAYALLIIVVAWVFFRADSPGHALAFLSAMFYFTEGSHPAIYLERFLSAEIKTIFVLGIVFSMPVRRFLASTPKSVLSRPYIQVPLYLFLYLYCVLAMALSSYSPFLYFRF